MRYELSVRFNTGQMKNIIYLFLLLTQITIELTNRMIGNTQLRITHITRARPSFIIMLSSEPLGRLPSIGN